MTYSVLCCFYCDFSCKQEIKFCEHLEKNHDIIDQQSLYDSKNGLRPSCECGCGSAVPWFGWKKGYTTKYVRGHNAESDTCFKNPEKIKEISNKRHEGYSSGKYVVWNKGKSSETDSRISETSIKIGQTLQQKYGNGEIVPWQIGQTKETNESLRKASETKKYLFSTGKIVPWAKGLTKENNEILRKIGEDVRQFYATNR